MTIYEEVLKERRLKLENELIKVSTELSNIKHNKVDSELENIDYNGKILFVEAPMFYYDLDKEMIMVYQDNLFMSTNMKKLTCGTYNISEKDTLQKMFYSFGDLKRVAFYLTKNDSIYHDGRIIRVAAF